MRIAYVSLHWPRTKNSGVGKKIQSQLAAWIERGHDARLFMHTSAYQPQTELIDAERFYYSNSGKAGTEIARMRAMARMITAIRYFRPDLIYLRYGIYVFPAHLLMNIAPVVEEINTDDLAQHETLGGFYSLYNRITRGIILRGVRGLVTVSRELSTSPAFATFHKPTRVISNGIDLGSIRPFPAPGNKTPRLFFMATPDYAWHGIDKLVMLGRRYPDMIIDVVGYQEIIDSGELPSNIRLHGYLPSTVYEKILGQADVAISTLALHRKNMKEASPLKTRECLAFGLPVVMAYTDTDLDDLDCTFLLKIPNRESNIETHGEHIHDFAFRMRGQRADREKLINRIDLHAKEDQRLDFFRETLVDHKTLAIDNSTH